MIRVMYEDTVCSWKRIAFSMGSIDIGIVIPSYIFVQPAISSTVPLMSANVVGLPPFNEPNINVYLPIEKLDISNAYF
jgi:hypothetical protein